MVLKPLRSRAEVERGLNFEFWPSGVELRKGSGGTTPRRRDFDAVYYMGVYNRIGAGKSPRPPVIRVPMTMLMMLYPWQDVATYSSLYRSRILPNASRRRKTWLLLELLRKPSTYHLRDAPRSNEWSKWFGKRPHRRLVTARGCEWIHPFLTVF